MDLRGFEEIKKEIGSGFVGRNSGRRYSPITGGSKPTFRSLLAQARQVSIDGKTYPFRGKQVCYRAPWGGD